MEIAPPTLWHVTKEETYNNIRRINKLFLYNIFRSDDISEVFLLRKTLFNIIKKIVVSNDLSERYPQILKTFTCDEMLRYSNFENRCFNCDIKYKNDCEFAKQNIQECLEYLFGRFRYLPIYIMSFGKGDKNLAKKRYRPLEETDTIAINFYTLSLQDLAKKNETGQLRFGKVLYIDNLVYTTVQNSSLMEEEHILAGYIENTILQRYMFGDFNSTNSLAKDILNDTLNHYCGFVKAAASTRKSHKSGLTLKSIQTCREHSDQNSSAGLGVECWHTDIEYRLVYYDFSMKNIIDITEGENRLNDIEQWLHENEIKSILEENVAINTVDRVEVDFGKMPLLGGYDKI
jgi:hypothetical protein